MSPMFHSSGDFDRSVDPCSSSGDKHLPAPVAKRAALTAALADRDRFHVGRCEGYHQCARRRSRLLGGYHAQRLFRQSPTGARASQTSEAARLTEGSGVRGDRSRHASLGCRRGKTAGTAPLADRDGRAVAATACHSAIACSSWPCFTNAGIHACFAPGFAISMALDDLPTIPTIAATH